MVTLEINTEKVDLINRQRLSIKNFEVAELPQRLEIKPALHHLKAAGLHRCRFNHHSAKESLPHESRR